LGNSYANESGLDGETFFTGAMEFKVKEIEVFELVDEVIEHNQNAVRIQCMLIDICERMTLMGG
jgi:hypothetical protein